jgi:hypothetical protein
MAQCWCGSGPNRSFSLGWWNNQQAPGGREFDIESMLIPKWQRQGWAGGFRMGGSCDCWWADRMGRRS